MLSLHLIIVIQCMDYQLTRKWKEAPGLMFKLNVVLSLHFELPDLSRFTEVCSVPWRKFTEPTKYIVKPPEFMVKSSEHPLKCWREILELEINIARKLLFCPWGASEYIVKSPETTSINPQNI